MKISEQLAKLALEMATQKNLFGKRLHDTKLELVENFVKAQALIEQVDPSGLLKWLEENRPSKPAAKRASEKPAANTMLGFVESRAENFPIVNRASYYVITAAQNNTSVDLNTINQLKSLVRSLNGELLVMPIHYNKNAFSSAVEDENEYFDQAVKPYLILEDHWLIKKGNIRLCSEARVSPTAKLPIRAAQQLNGGEHATIVPHTKQQLVTLPRLSNQPIKEAWTTGTCTNRNYVASRAGSEAETDHIFGGLLVSVYDNGQFNIINLVIGDDGKLGLTQNYIDSTYKPWVVLGDLHCEMFDPKCWLDTVTYLSDYSGQIGGVVVHDILHFSTRSHHSRNSGKHLYQNKDNTVQNDLEQVISQINELADLVPMVYICESNHNSALDNWLDDLTYKPQFDSHNSKLYYLLNWLVCDTIDQGQDATIALKLALENSELTGLPSLAENIVFGKMDDPFIVYGTDLSQHGHKGQNGSAGNTNLFSKWKIPLVTGHTHSPTIIGSVLTVGVTARMNQIYNRGAASSWAQSHGILYPNGTRQILPMNIRG